MIFEGQVLVHAGLDWHNFANKHQVDHSLLHSIPSTPFNSIPVMYEAGGYACSKRMEQFSSVQRSRRVNDGKGWKRYPIQFDEQLMYG